MTNSERLRQMREGNAGALQAPVVARRATTHFSPSNEGAKQEVARSKSLKRKPRAKVRKKRKGPPRKGRIVDKPYLAFIAAQPCMISGKPATVHHVKEGPGAQKNDRRTLPLAPEYHQIQAGEDSIEKLGKKKFEARHNVNLEERILHYQAAYIAVGGKVKS